MINRLQKDNYLLFTHRLAKFWECNWNCLKCLSNNHSLINKTNLHCYSAHLKRIEQYFVKVALFLLGRHVPKGIWRVSKKCLASTLNCRWVWLCGTLWGMGGGGGLNTAVSWLDYNNPHPSKNEKRKGKLCLKTLFQINSVKTEDIFLVQGPSHGVKFECFTDYSYCNMILDD